jgi:hypothetical protein
LAMVFSLCEVHPLDGAARAFSTSSPKFLGTGSLRAS